MCARDFTSSPGVCDTTLNRREINFKQKNDMGEKEELRRKKSKKREFLERR